MHPVLRTLACMAFGLPSPAQGDCTACGATGVLPCRRCPLTCEESTRWCSEAVACAECRGVLQRVCPECAPATAVDRLRLRQDLARRRWSTRRAELQAAAGGPAGVLRRLVYCAGPDLEVGFAAGRVPAAPVSDPHRLAHVYFDRILAARARFQQVLGLRAADFPPPSGSRPAAGPTVAGGAARSVASPRLRLLVLDDERIHRRLCPQRCGLVHQGLGGKRLGGDMVYVLYRDAGRLRDDAALHRDIVHNVTHLLLANLQPVGWLGERGFGWLDSGLAHYFEAAAGGGICSTFCHHEHSQPPLLYRDGHWLAAARELLGEGRLPPVADWLAANTAELDPEQHVAAFALVSYLIDRHGGPAVGELLRRIRRGQTLRAVVPALFGCAVGELDGRLRGWLAGAAAPPQPLVTRGADGLRVALYVYTREHVRPRHVEVVRRALARRAAAHTSGFAIERGRPVHRLGPVNGNVRHWRGPRNVSKVGRAWPFAAVLEFERGAGRRGYLDWFRRKRGSRDGGAWFLDPAGTYVEHINAETVCHQDDRFCYMAVVDTPTGAVIGSNEFAVRGRVTDAAGRSIHRGWWVRFFVNRGEPLDWAEQLTPLVSWRVDGVRAGGGVQTIGRVADPERELAVWGTGTVFRFPAIPAGIRPCVSK